MCITEVVIHRETVYPNEMGEMAQVDQLCKPPLLPPCQAGSKPLTPDKNRVRHAGENTSEAKYIDAVIIE